ncbi:LYR motif-containing protein 4-like [Dendronephthya gigantea]|uniref:LYR motif-containing protein 4-like n=1 Tax=Dendronephthya gigantea TaxID=151771 RepID=UPI00106C8D24|nr:LYR motif-containing protein 4-like [Dendronephthya gigantea]
MAARKEVLHLYRLLLRESYNFTNYNYRLYALRKVRDCFRANKDETDPEKVRSFIIKAHQNLDSLKRQTSLNKMYGTFKLIIES